jgi:hypothetical protein
MSTVVGIAFIQKAPEDALFVVPDLGPALVTKKFAMFHCIMGRIVAAKASR